MVAKNDITNDEIKTGMNSKQYEDGWKRIFGANKKQTAKYEARESDPHVVVGHSTYLRVTEHPRKNEFIGEILKTSRVVSYDEKTGRIETENTIYERVSYE